MINHACSYYIMGFRRGIDVSGYDPEVAKLATEALDEVNQLRAKHGLPPFEKDECLTEAAKYLAVERAKALCFGHANNDFKGLPEGCHADVTGCAGNSPEWGFMACSMYDRHKYAGAASMIGSDGNRYCHIFYRD